MKHFLKTHFSWMAWYKASRYVVYRLCLVKSDKNFLTVMYHVYISRELFHSFRHLWLAHYQMFGEGSHFYYWQYFLHALPFQCSRLILGKYVFCVRSESFVLFSFFYLFVYVTSRWRGVYCQILKYHLIISLWRRACWHYKSVSH